MSQTNGLAVLVPPLTWPDHWVSHPAVADNKEWWYRSDAAIIQDDVDMSQNVRLGSEFHFSVACVTKRCPS